MTFSSFRSASLLVTALLGLTAACAPADDSGDPGSPDGASEAPERLGSVELDVSCGPAADSALARGLALLHHMTYEPAEAAFARAEAADSACALAHWGQAMTYVHPLWSDPPTEEKFDRGAAHVAAARAIEALTARERAYVEAVGAYYDAGRGTVERPNLEAFEAGWATAHEQFPEDTEIAAFHALSLLATADPGDKSYAAQRRAGELAEQVLAEHPDHPGAHHYVIHAYDYPALADEALRVAESYGDIAPSVPHALHMPTHIFTRLGRWDASIEFNRRSAEAARGNPVDGKVSLHFFHALDYLAYAHLQRAEWEEAQAVLDTLRGVEGPFMVEVATPYALAAVPARVALEQQRWSAAAALPARVPESYPWDRFPAIEAITHFARGIGAARSGDAAAARASAERLGELRRAAAGTSRYWADQVEVQRLAVTAWATFAAGDEAGGLRLMRQAADLEAATEKHPVTPGEIIPARELLADMLMEMERYGAAEEAYAATLERSPRRLRALGGAARAAELAGDSVSAARYYRELLELTEEGEPAADVVDRARRYVSAAG